MELALPWTSMAWNPRWKWRERQAETLGTKLSCSVVQLFSSSFFEERAGFGGVEPQYQFTMHQFTMGVQFPQAVQVHCIATEPTFFGNYAPPDDLDGQIIDLVSWFG